MSGKARNSVKDAVRTFNKFVLNPVMMHLAGRKNWYASVIRHTGRRTGKTYATPVVAEQVASGFVVPLPYGTGVDWLRNMMTAGKATIVTQGKAYDVIEPEIIDAADAGPLLSDRRRRVFARLRVKDFVKFRASA